MKYDPKAAKGMVLTGKFPATIQDAVESKSKTGRDMVVFTYTVYADGREYTQKHWCVGMEQADGTVNWWSLKNVAKAIGNEAAFESGTFDPTDYIGRDLVVECGPSKDNPEMGGVKKVFPKGALHDTGSIRSPAVVEPKAKVAPRPPVKLVDTEINEDDIPF
jgi:hypothetical protein